MAGLQNYLGQVLDAKYRLERLLGQGGMGAVYLATHLGTERYVALKLITPQFMQNEEFVERFKREARAAGRLRHPNVVDVTDFGFAEASGDTVAYLVMEYLDGCTLGDVLREEKKLPLEWVVDILEQVCSAVGEAHQQGIVHRDLKPENIWLEPNRLGGYRVKVLDFGIAKVAALKSLEADGGNGGNSDGANLTQLGQSVTHVRGGNEAATVMLPSAATNITNFTPGETDTQLFDAAPIEEEGERSGSQTSVNAEAVHTKVFESTGAAAVAAVSAEEKPKVEDDDRTLLFGDTTQRLVSESHSATQEIHAGELTRVGAIMGTPLYMSPEQCNGKPSDARSDLYSLGVIAYQMLAGEPPFTGETSKIMREHVERTPQPLRERSKVPKRVANVVMSALAKNPDDRPQSVTTFASSLRAHSDGIGSLYRRAFALYSEYFPKFLKLSLLAHIPVFVSTALLIACQLIEQSQPKGMNFGKIAASIALLIAVLLQVITYFVAASVISGMTAIIVTQVTAVPLRPVQLRTALNVFKRRWKTFLKTSITVTVRIILGWLLIIPGFVMTFRYALWAPVVLMEGLERKAALKRSRQLASRSWRTVIIITMLQFLIPAIVGALVGRLSVRTTSGGSGVSVQSAWQHLSGLTNVVIIPLMSIVPALLYLKMRQLGGESLTTLLSEIEDPQAQHSQWQQRMRTRISLAQRSGSGSLGKSRTGG